MAGAGAVASTGLASASNTAQNKKVKVLTMDNELVEVDSSQLKMAEKPKDVSYLKTQGRIGLQNRKFVMVVDWRKCKNARKCMSACQSAHQLKPEQHHINVLQINDAENGSSYFMPKPCMHCVCTLRNGLPC